MSDTLIAGLSAERFVAEVYRGFLGREPDPSAAAKVQALIAGSTTPEGVMAEVLGSAEYRDHVAQPGPLLNDHTQYGELQLLMGRWIAQAAPAQVVVDVGARGRDRSNSYDLLKHFGWRGILIEANPALIEGLERDFAGLDIDLISCAVSDYDGEAIFHIGSNDDVSSLTEAASLSWGPTTGQVTVPVRRLAPLLEVRGVPTDFGLLSIDIEGEDIRVLNDVVAAGFRPRWVIIEASYDFATRSLDQLAFDEGVRQAYAIVAQTSANLILERTDLDQAETRMQRPAPARTTSDDDVRWAYEHALGRPPETPETVALQRSTWPDPEAFLRAILASDEFVASRRLNNVSKVFKTLMLAEPMVIDHHVSPDLEQRMMDRTRAEWTRLGEEEPHWSVMSHEDFRADALDDAALERFYQGGRPWADLVDIFAGRAEKALTPGVCLELGCGVGRITRYLAERFETVIGVDISPGNLALCRRHLDDTGITNVETVQVAGLEDFDALPPIDYFYSMIVLQHNPPPIQLAILRRIFQRLKPDGQALFQVQALLTDYMFDAEAYVESATTGMEMHVLPRHVVLAEMQAHDIEVLDVVPDPFSGGIGSVVFHGVKRTPPPEPPPPPRLPLLRRLLAAARNAS